MLLLVLLVILAAGGVLVASVLTSHSQWAWISVVLSVVGALLLVVARGRRRRPDAGDGDVDHGADEHEEITQVSRDTGDDTDDEDVGPEPVSTPQRAGPLSGGNPTEEDTDAADALVVSELDSTVVVLDEYPRYHLEECPWLEDRETIPLPVREARDLGFTPCSGCTPDAILAARDRSTS